MDGVDRCLHAFGNLLHVDIGGGCRSGVPKHTLHVLHCALLLSQRSNRSPDNLERQLRQSQVFGQFVKNPLPVVVRVQKSPGLIREMKASGVGSGACCLHAASGGRGPQRARFWRDGVEELEHLGVGFVSLTEALDLTTPAGPAMAGLRAVFAEFEREILRERVRAGLAHARANGKRLGRPLTAAL